MPSALAALLGTPAPPLSSVPAQLIRLSLARSPWPPRSFLPGHAPSLPWVQWGRARLGGPSGCPPPRLPAGREQSGLAPRGPHEGPPRGHSPPPAPMPGDWTWSSIPRRAGWHPLGMVPSSSHHLPWALGVPGGQASHPCPGRGEKLVKHQRDSRAQGSRAILVWPLLAPIGHPSAPRRAPRPCKR